MANNFQISGIICELNPLHSGHCSLLERFSQKGPVIAVMSGSFVQRGEPAVFDKWTRAEAALSAGADLVLELPLPWAIGRAETFAFGGVSLLDSLRCVDVLAFGSESGRIAPLQAVADILDSPDFSTALENAHREMLGSPFAVLRQQAVTALLGKQAAALLDQPNNTLGVAYCQALRRLGSSIRPETIQRLGAGYHQTEGRDGDQYPSATQLRATLRRAADADLAPFMPPSCVAILQKAIAAGRGPVFPENLEQAILAKLRTCSLEDLAQLPDVSEGLERRLYQAIPTAASLAQLYDRVKTKRYSHARIRRLALSAFLGVTKDDTAAPPPYCRVLGMTKRGARLLSTIGKTAAIPLIVRYSDTKTLDEFGRRIFGLECRATDLYGLACPTVQPCRLDLTKRVIVEK